MSDKYIITKEEINQILLHSPYALSLTPSKNGMSGEQTKKYFYDFIPVLVEKLNFKMKDIEFSEQANEKMVDEIWEAINTLGADIVSAMSRATQAYNLACGKNKVHIYGNPRNLFGDILDSVNTPAKDFQVGDFILITEKGFPDFIVSSSPDDVKIPPNGYVLVTAENYLDVEIKEGTTYAFLNGFSLVGIESGIDTSVFATKEKLEEVESIAKGANQAVSFADYEAMQNALKNYPKDKYSVGQSILIKTLDVPDLWVYSISGTSFNVPYTDSGILNAFANGYKIQVGYFVLAPLETQKVNLTDYATKQYVDNKTLDLSNYVDETYATKEELENVGGATTQKGFEYIGSMTVAPDENGNLANAIVLSKTGDHKTSYEEGEIEPTGETFELTDFYVKFTGSIYKESGVGDSAKVNLYVNTTAALFGQALIASLKNPSTRRWDCSYRSYGEDMGGQASYAGGTISSAGNFPNSSISNWQSVQIPPNLDKSTSYRYNILSNVKLECSTEGDYFSEGTKIEIWGIRK